MTFKDFFLHNRRKDFFYILSDLMEEKYNETFVEKISTLDQAFKISLYVLWKKFDYTTSVILSEKISKKNIDYDILCNAILREIPSGFSREIVTRIINVMVELGILVAEEIDDPYQGEKTLFGINKIIIRINEKEIETFEEFKSKMEKSPNFSVLHEDSDVYFIDLYYRTIIRTIQR